RSTIPKTWAPSSKASNASCTDYFRKSPGRRTGVKGLIHRLVGDFRMDHGNPARIDNRHQNTAFLVGLIGVQQTVFLNEKRIFPGRKGRLVEAVFIRC